MARAIDLSNCASLEEQIYKASLVLQHIENYYAESNINNFNNLNIDYSFSTNTTRIRLELPITQQVQQGGKEIKINAKQYIIVEPPLADYPDPPWL